MGKPHIDYDTFFFRDAATAVHTKGGELAPAQGGNFSFSALGAKDGKNEIAKIGMDEKTRGHLHNFFGGKFGGTAAQIHFASDLEDGLTFVDERMLQDPIQSLDKIAGKFGRGNNHISSEHAGVSVVRSIVATLGAGYPDSAPLFDAALLEFYERGFERKLRKLGEVYKDWRAQREGSDLPTEITPEIEALLRAEFVQRTNIPDSDIARAALHFQGTAVRELVGFQRRVLAKIRVDPDKIMLASALQASNELRRSEGSKAMKIAHTIQGWYEGFADEIEDFVQEQQGIDVQQKLEERKQHMLLILGRAEEHAAGIPLPENPLDLLRGDRKLITPHAVTKSLLAFHDAVQLRKKLMTHGRILAERIAEQVPFLGGPQSLTRHDVQQALIEHRKH